MNLWFKERLTRCRRRQSPGRICCLYWGRRHITYSLIGSRMTVLYLDTGFQYHSAITCGARSENKCKQWSRPWGLFLESPENFSGPKSQLWNCNPLVLKSSSFKLSQCKKAKRTAEVDGLETRRCKGIKGIEALEKQTCLYGLGLTETKLTQLCKIRILIWPSFSYFVSFKSIVAFLNPEIGQTYLNGAVICSLNKLKSASEIMIH